MSSLEPVSRIASSFGLEDMVLIDMASKITSQFTVFTLDTGRLHEETYLTMDRTRSHYGICHPILFPKNGSVEQLEREKGFTRSGKAWRTGRNVVPSARWNRCRGRSHLWKRGSPVSAGTRASPARTFPRWRRYRPPSPDQGQPDCRLVAGTGSGIYRTRTKFPSIRSTNRTIRVSAVPPAPAPSKREKTSAPAAGGGKTPTTKNAASTAQRDAGLNNQEPKHPM